MNFLPFLLADYSIANNPLNPRSPFTVTPLRRHYANYQFDVSPGRRVLHFDNNSIQQKAVVRPIKGFLQTTSPMVRRRLK